jgi:hypothetical protein
VGVFSRALFGASGYQISVVVAMETPQQMGRKQVGGLCSDFWIEHHFVWSLPMEKKVSCRNSSLNG